MLAYARSLGVPVIHVKLVMRRLHNGGSETSIVPFWQALHKIRDEQDRLTPGRRSTVNEHNVEGSPGCDIIPELYDESDYVIDNKKRLDCFIGTDLDILLKSLGDLCLLGCPRELELVEFARTRRTGVGLPQSHSQPAHRVLAPLAAIAALATTSLRLP